MIFLNSLFDIFLTLILSFYMLLELKNVKNFVLNLTNVTSFNFFSNILEDINLTLSNYIRGQGLICLTLSVFYSIYFIFNYVRFWNNFRTICWNYIFHSIYWSYNRSFNCSCFRWNSIWFEF